MQRKHCCLVQVRRKGAKYIGVPSRPASSRDALRPREGNAKAVEESFQAKEEHEPSVLQSPWQAGYAVRMDGALVCGRTDGRLLPSSHHDLQHLSPSLAVCLWLYKAQQGRAVNGAQLL